MKQCLTALLILFSFNASADITRWVDENNKVHYSDQPPPVNVKVKPKTLRSTSNSNSSMDTSSAAEPPKSAAPKTIAERAADLRKAKQAKMEAADMAAQKQVEEEASKANCTNAQQSLKSLQDGLRIVELDANGERAYLDDEQLQARITKTQQDISKLCK
jgi:hypothetical protein